MSNLEYMQRDLAVVWHPCTQMKDHETLPMIPIRRGEGVFLEDFEGKRYLDAISSWWVNLFGHANPRINAALRAQLDNLEHVMLAGFTHEPVIELSERLVKLAPQGLTRCSYADNGASAIEIALKMSFHYWHNCDKPQKTKFLTLANSYHGETLGALAVGNVALFKETYASLLMHTFTAPSPAGTDREAGETVDAYAYRQFQVLETMLADHADELAAVIVEPLVQCAAGMRMYPAVYLQWLRAACDKYQVHLIADEIAVGFGRTGTMFACEQAGIRPDFLCLSKGITGGYLPLSAVLTTEDVYRAFYADYAQLSAFLHSHSYTGNALACRAALATLDIFAEDDVLTKNKMLSETLWAATAPLQDHPHVLEVRQQGMILAIEIVKNKARREAYPWQERRGLRMYQYALQHGALLRPMGGVLYFMPPYVITPEQIYQLAEIATGAIDAATRD